MPLIPQMAGSLSLAGAPSRHRWIASPLGRLPRPVNIVDGWDDHPQRADVGRVLDVPFLRIRQPDHGDRR